MTLIKKVKYVLFGGVALASIAFGYPIIGFYFPSDVPIPTADKSATPLGEFCADGQRIMTGTTTVPIDNQLYDSFDNFVLSKAAVDEASLRPAQLIVYDESPMGETFPKLVSCKFKSADRIKMIRGDNAAGEEGTCKEINQRTVQSTLDRLDLPNPPQITFEEDEVEDRGQLWLDPWPYPAVKQDEDGNLRIQAGATYTPYTSFHVMPARFLGVHYCHLVTSEYVEKLLTGEVSARK